MHSSKTDLVLGFKKNEEEMEFFIVCFTNAYFKISASETKTSWGGAVCRVVIAKIWLSAYSITTNFFDNKIAPCEFFNLQK